MKNVFTNVRTQLLISLAVFGPGLITAFADNDAGGVATYSVAASKFGYSILTTLIPITLVLFITQEIGARIAIMTNKGLADLIRERYGVKVTMFVFILLFVVNFGVILQDVGGLKDSLVLFGLNYRIFLPLIVLSMFMFLIMASYSIIERFFIIVILFYFTYLFSAILAKPDWGLTARSLVIPQRSLSFDYLYTSVAVLGTTVTAWGQFFINSYIKDKKITPERLRYEQVEIGISSFLTNVFSLFIMVAVSATLFINNIKIESASDAVLAIKPLAGDMAGQLFAIGLFVAGFLGSIIVPLSTAYAFSEFFGFERSLNIDFQRGRMYYGFFLIQVILGTVVLLFPQISLFRITLYADFLNGIMLPLIFFFLYKLSNDEVLMGAYKNNRVQNSLLIGSGVIISIASIVGGVGEFLHF